MKTITAKDLRDHLDEIVERVRNGETIRVTYRSKPAFRIEPDVQGPELAPGSPAAMKEFVQMMQELNRTGRRSALDPNRPIKELEHELLDSDPKYQSPHE